VTQIFRYRYQYPGKEFGCNPTRMFLVVMWHKSNVHGCDLLVMFMVVSCDQKLMCMFVTQEYPGNVFDCKSKKNVYGCVPKVLCTGTVCLLPKRNIYCCDPNGILF
jgi:hypothetical protein